MDRRDFLSVTSGTGAIALARKAWSGTPEDQPTKSIRIAGTLWRATTIEVEPVDGWPKGTRLRLKSLHVHVTDKPVALVEHCGFDGGHFELAWVVE